MATFKKQFEDAYRDVEKKEKDRAQYVREAGYRAYSDMLNEESDSQTLHFAADDCERTAQAYLKLAKMAEAMARAFNKQADRLETAAERLD